MVSEPVLPEAYRDFVRKFDGKSGWLRGMYVSLWPEAERESLCQAYGIEGLPGVIGFGSDGGSEAIVFDTLASENPEEWPVCQAPFIGMNRDLLEKLADSFAEWVKGAELLEEAPEQEKIYG